VRFVLFLTVFIMDLNMAQVIGNLTRDPEAKTLDNGSKVVSFGIATNRSWKNDKGEKQEEVEFHNVSAWGGLAGVCEQYLKKGSKVYIQGRMKTSRWENDKGKQSKMEIVADNMQMLDSKFKGAGISETVGEKVEVVDMESVEA
jgi:single-strand DNA-binding protein